MTKVVLSGPDIERGYPSSSIALSAAITYASRALRTGGIASYYVRTNDVLTGRVDVAGAEIRVWGEETINEYARRGLSLPEIPDGALASEPIAATAPLANGQPGYTRRPRKEPQVAEETKNARKRSTRSAAAAAKPDPEVEAGDTPADDLHKQVEHVTAKQATVQVLKRANGPLSGDEIVKRVLKVRGLKLAGKTPNATIMAMLAVENKKSDGLFIRTSPGTYTLREAPKQGAKARA